MKHFFTALAGGALLLALPLASVAQTSAGVTIGAATAADVSAALDVVSSGKGALLPRMTSTQRGAIGSPAPGLIVFQTDAPIGFYYNAGTAASPSWQQIATASGAAITASNGLTKTGANVALGGALTGATTIGLGANSLTFSSTTGTVGIGALSAARLHVRGTGNALPATTGTTQSVGLISRFQTIDNAILDIGGNSGNGAWLQSTDITALNLSYPLLLNPNGGNVGINTGTVAPSEKLQVEAGNLYVRGEGQGVIVDEGTSKRTGLVKYAGKPTGLWRANGIAMAIGRVTTAGGVLPGSPTAYFEDILLTNTGAVNMLSLAGTGTRVVVADAGGGLSATTALPTSADYIQNQTSSSQSANFRISGDGAVGGAVNVDFASANDGTFNGAGGALRFGAVGTGEGIASKRTGTGNQFGLDFYTGYQSRLAITNAGRVGIGTSGPAYPLDVVGDVNSSTMFRAGGLPALYLRAGNYFVGTGSYAATAPTGIDNTLVGYNGGAALTSGSNNTTLGSAAGGALTTGSSNVLLGIHAGANLTTGSDNIFIGHDPGVSSSGSENIGLGHNVLNQVTSSGNVSIGSQSGQQVISGGNNTFVGTNADLSSAQQHLRATAIGYNAKVDLDDAVVLGDAANSATRVGIGTSQPSATLHVGGTGSTVRLEGLTGAGTRVVTADLNGNLSTTAVATVGDNLGNHTATANLNLTNKLLVGGTAAFPGSTGLGVNFDGSLSLGGAGLANRINSTSLALGNTSYGSVTGVGNVFVGDLSGQGITSGERNTYLGYLAGSGASGASSHNTALGFDAAGVASGSYGTFVGEYAGRANSGTSNVGIGAGASLATTGNNNTSVGYSAANIGTQAGGNNVSVGGNAGLNNNGGENTFLGAFSGEGNTSGTQNTFVGMQAGATSNSGGQNAFLGFNSGKDNSTGSSNVYVGSLAGRYNTDGSFNTMIGNNASTGSGGTSYTNATAIGANALVQQSNSLVLGNSVNVGIGTSTPAATLHVAGTAGTANVRLESLGGTGTRVVTADASGNLNAAGALPTSTDYIQNQTTATQTGGFKVSGAGSVAGLLTGTGGATITGFTAINTSSSSGNTNIGNSINNVNLTGSSVNVTSGTTNITGNSATNINITGTGATTIGNPGATTLVNASTLIVTGTTTSITSTTTINGTGSSNTNLNTGTNTGAVNIGHTGGTVGITGTTTLTGTLTTTGTVTAPTGNSYAFTTAQTRTTAVSCNSFQPIGSGGWNTSLAGPSSNILSGFIPNGTAGLAQSVYADVTLPNGAVITGVSALILDNNASNASVAVESVSLSTGIATNIGSTGSSTGTNTSFTTLNSGTLSATVDNSTNRYQLRFNTAENTGTLRIAHAIVTYTVSKAD